MAVWTWWVLYMVFHTAMNSCLAEACPDRCNCYQSSDCNGTAVLCYERSLTSVPTAFPNDTCSIDLSRNDITSIEKEAFAGLASLQTLKLDHNDITSIEKEAFTGLANLELLDLSGNNIASIEKETFVALTSLQRLELDDNDITSIDKKAFTGLANLEILYLTGNNLTSIEKETFATLTSLRGFKLDHNDITSIEKEVFTGLANLELLDLSENNIASIEKETFAALTSLQGLYLEHNDITSIEKEAFTGLANLEILGLSKNKITSIEKETFVALTSLRGLDLFRNNITSVKKEAFAALTRLQELSIGDNPFHCNCRLEDFVDFMKGNITYAGFTRYREPQCSTPSYLRGKNLSDVPFKEMECPNSAIHGENKSIVYTRWGKKVCPPNAELDSWEVQVMRIVDQLLTHSAYLEIHSDGTNTARACVYGTEYEIYSFSNHIDKLVNHDVPCAVCLVKNRSILTMFPARTTCYKGWSFEYGVYLIAGNYAHPAGTMFRCLDKHPDSLHGGYDGRSGSLIYPVEARCGLLKCPPYVEGRELACFVCSKNKNVQRQSLCLRE